MTHVSYVSVSREPKAAKTKHSTHLLGGQRLAAKVIDTRCEALLDEVGVHAEKVVHLRTC